MGYHENEPCSVYAGVIDPSPARAGAARVIITTVYAYNHLTVHAGVHPNALHIVSLAVLPTSIWQYPRTLRECLRKCSATRARARPRRRYSGRVYSAPKEPSRLVMIHAARVPSSVR